MFDTADNSDPIDRIVTHTSGILRELKPGAGLMAHRDQVASAILCAAARMFDGDEKVLIAAIADLHKADLDGTHDEDALHFLDDASAAIHAAHTARMEDAS